MSAAPVSLYVHIPFCTLKCSYCDFNSYAGIEGLMGPFVEALCEEMKLWGVALREGTSGSTEPQGEALSVTSAAEVSRQTERAEVLPEAMGASPLPSRTLSMLTRPRRRVETVFFGGGTPSLLPLAEVERVMGTMREAFDPSPPGPLSRSAGEGEKELEVSFEANPGTVDRDYLRGLRSLGVNRISFGVQSFHDDELAALDRIHSAEEAKEAYGWAREAGFERINLDLIYGLTERFDSPSAPLRAAQGERMRRWQATLKEALALGPEHLSLYALTVEEGTKLAHDIERGRAPAPDGDLQAAMYEWSCEWLAAAGYRQYEISNWCRPGEECRHNLVYWRNGEWLGVGPGAHSHLTGNWKSENGNRPAGVRFADVYSPRQYIERVNETVEASRRFSPGWLLAPSSLLLSSMRQVAFVDEQSDEMEMADTAILGLRLNEGLDVDAFSRRFGRSLEDVYGPVLAETASFGLVERENGRVRLTERGRLLANEVFVRLLAD